MTDYKDVAESLDKHLTDMGNIIYDLYQTSNIASAKNDPAGKAVMQMVSQLIVGATKLRDSIYPVRQIFD